MLEFPAVGDLYYSTGALIEAGTRGRYWSATQYTNATNAYYLFFSSSRVNVENYTKTYGYSVRCVRQEFTTLILIF